MAIGFSRKEGQRFCIIDEQGREAWVLIHEGITSKGRRTSFKFDLPEGWKAFREELYSRVRNGTYRQEPQIRPTNAS